MTGRWLLAVLLLAAPAAAGTLRGVAVDDLTNRPVGEAQVVLLADSARYATTDSLGAFAFRGVPADKYTLQIAGIHYDIWSTEVVVSERDTANVQARLIALPILGSLAGVVTEGGGKRGLRHAHVAVEDLGIEVVTEDDGTYWLDGLSAGTHRVRVTALGHDPVTLAANVEPERGTYLAVDLPPSGRKTPRETVLPAADTSAVIRFVVPDTSRSMGLGARRPVRLEILQQDRPVRTLIAGPLAAESYAVFWDGRDDRGRKLPPGAFRYRLRIAQSTAAEGDLLLR